MTTWSARTAFASSPRVTVRVAAHVHSCSANILSRFRRCSAPHHFAAHELAYDALRKPQKRLQKLLERPEEEMEKVSSQRKIEEGEIDEERLQVRSAHAARLFLVWTLTGRCPRRS